MDDEKDADKLIYETIDVNSSSNDKDESTKTDIIKLNEEIDNINVFKKNMLIKGYTEVSNRFLTKNFAESTNPDDIYYVNITINDGIITAITAYDENNKVTNIPQSIINTVKNDISESLTAFI